jgi:septation ring formation regulator EzrA
MAKDSKPNMSEIAEILYAAGENYENISKKRMDDYDALISRIIMIEKVHKYGSAGKDKKMKEITEEIESFITKEE